MSKANISLVLVGLLLILSLGLVDAQPPFQQSDISTGLVVESGYPIAHKLGEDFYLHAHVYNATDGRLLTTGLNCFYHFYNHQINGGEHISTGILSQYGMGFYNYTNGSLINQTGEYSALIWCNSTDAGGFFKYTFDVTPNGEYATTGDAVFYFSVIMVLVFFLGMCMLSFAKFNNLLNRVGMIGLSYLLAIALSFIVWNMALNFLTGSPFAIEMFRIIFLVLVIGLFPLLIGAFAWYFLMLWKIKEIQNLMDKGMSFDEAERRQGRKYK